MSLYKVSATVKLDKNDARISPNAFKQTTVGFRLVEKLYGIGF